MPTPSLPMPKILGSKRQIQLLRKQYCQDLDDDQFETYVYVCKATGLDPLQRQIYAIRRWNSDRNCFDLTIQTGIDGYRLLAANSEVYAGSDPPEFVENPDDPKHPLRARVTVHKIVNGERYAFTGEARWDEYAQKTKEGELMGRWKDMGHNQLAKCAEAQAIRKGFPAQTANIHVHEEMQAVDLDVKGTGTAAPKAIVEAGKIYDATLQAVSIGLEKKRSTRLVFMLQGGAEAIITSWHIQHPPENTTPWAQLLGKKCQFSFTETPNKKGGEPYRDLTHFALEPQKQSLDSYLAMLKGADSLDTLEDVWSQIKTENETSPADVKMKLTTAFEDKKKELMKT